MSIIKGKFSVLCREKCKIFLNLVTYHLKGYIHTNSTLTPTQCNLGSSLTHQSLGTHPPAQTFEPLLDFVGSRYLLWKVYSTKLASQLATIQSPRNVLATYNIAILTISSRILMILKQNFSNQIIQLSKGKGS